MKKSLLIGLAAVALGSMTACSNILEEEGIVSPSAKTGTLTIGVEADASVNVTTKTEEDLSEKYLQYLDDFKIKLTVPAGVNFPETYPSSGDVFYKDIKNKKYKFPAQVGYSLTASYGTMNSQSFAWDCPVFEGTSSSFDVVANKLTTETVSCTLQNSIIDVNVTELNTDSDGGNGVIVTSLYAMVEDDDDTKFYLIGDGVESGKSLTGNIFYVAANVDAKLFMEGHLESDSSKEFKTTATEIQSNNETEPTATTKGKTKYKVKYTLSNANGELQLVVSIDGKVTVVDINKVVDPYTPATNS